MPTILITGANRGIGRELVDAYLADDWRVIAACREPAAAGLECECLELDVASDDSVHTLTTSLEGIAIDVLWNNAGVYLDKGTALEDMDYDAWAESMLVNAQSPIRLCAALMANVEASDRKTMAFTTSKMASIELNSGGAYAYRSSKIALNMAVDCLTKDVAAKGIKTVLLHPGWVRTDMGGASADIDAATSARGMKAVVDGLTQDQSGSFRNYDGTAFPW